MPKIPPSFGQTIPNPAVFETKNTVVQFFSIFLTHICNL